MFGNRRRAGGRSRGANISGGDASSDSGAVHLIDFHAQLAGQPPDGRSRQDLALLVRFVVGR
ncbi:MAG TPA: hypothetical protein VLJ39_12810 [Tepidisphaeraceae bacterium]|nr:hypothetical protein [Tepidisphaeraceae bacterium]